MTASATSLMAGGKGIASVAKSRIDAVFPWEPAGFLARGMRIRYHVAAIHGHALPRFGGGSWLKQRCDSPYRLFAKYGQYLAGLSVADNDF